MCRKYGSGKAAYVRCCKLSRFPGLRLYYDGEIPPLSAAGHVTYESLRGRIYTLTKPPKRKAR